jgi:hypothetical protein
MQAAAAVVITSPRAEQAATAAAAVAVLLQTHQVSTAQPFQAAVQAAADLQAAAV